MKKLSIFYIAVVLLGVFSCDSDDDNSSEQIYFQDLDNDGIGNENVSIIASEASIGYVLESGDFDDNNAEVKTIQDASLAVLLSLGGTDTYALETYANVNRYIQHNQSFLDGSGFVINAIKSGLLAGTTYEVSRIITDTNADGDTIVILHGIYAGNWNGGNPQIAFDVFRFDADSGLIEEHWDNLISPTDPLIDSINGNTQLDGSTLIIDEDQTDANKSIVQNFLNDVLTGGMWATLGPNFFGDSRDYIQHSPGVENGIEGFDVLGDNYSKYDTESPRFIYGEGNFVLTMSQGNEAVGLGDMAYYDLFILEDGKIVEHWDITQEIIADDLAANTNGKW